MNQLLKAALLLLSLIILPLASGADTCSLNDASCTNSSQTVEPGNNLHDPEAICIAYFYGDGCSNCAKTEPFIESLEAKYAGKIHFYKYEVYNNPENIKLYSQLCSIQNIPLEQQGVPLVAINDKYFMGSDSIRNGLETEIQATLESGVRICPIGGEMQCHLQPANQSQTNPLIPSLKQGVTVPLIIGTGLIDGINPCAFSVLIFLLTFLLTVSNDKKRMLKAGLAYVIGVYITYFLAGLGLLTAIHVTGLSAIIVKIAAALAIIVGLINIKDFWYGKGFTLAIPKAARSTIEKWTHRANVPAALVLGFLVAMFELPCTGGVYLAIIALLANTTTQAMAILYLLLYNLMFILPLLLIIYLVTKGMRAEQIERWRQAKKNWMKLVMGLVLLALGIAMLLGII